ncbi:MULTISPECIES: hypothetical protein [unclassified Rhizobium]|uniref:hypothetical protein n=1 Tax=unclassified Rhizobium TaxID=2613769 RepID=UPI0006FF0875|nr:MULTISPECIES: hypothetical protein [unclassified Rhizobium]KQV38915.1 hypothetical protein ASC86_23680 [Rhizobium sp. Root1212]KRD34983.1 hypothetical protein ASE37_22250 [Rhizobium sp. Root268]
MDLQSIPPKDAFIVTSVLDAWCNDHKIKRKDALKQATILVAKYHEGTRSQMELTDALIEK